MAAAPTTNSDRTYLWWETGTIYQIYPRSFQDSDQDGVGDLNGIYSRLEYLHWLGVNCIWLSPIFPSPMADFGYDISDYREIHPLFGTMDDFNRLLGEVHRLGMKLILDLVPNHTSDQHPWFLESKSSKDNPKRDWYIWQDAKENGDVPNNWLSVFGGYAWEWDEVTDQYYYHAFLKEQPDLNWRNPEVQQAVFSEMRFWLDKGVDGFRVDVLWHMIKDKQLRNNPVSPHSGFHADNLIYDHYLPLFSTDQPEVHEIARMMREVTDGYHERVLIGEIYLPIDKLVTYYGQQLNETHLPFNFQLLNLPWDSEKISLVVHEYEAAIPAGGWPNWVLGNHDKPRISSRIGRSPARVAAMLLLTLRGTPTLYYGDEIGMRDVPIPMDEIVDPQGLNMPDLNVSRDPARTPMQWDGSENAGFSTHKPWLRFPHDAKSINVEKQKRDPDSMLTLYRRLIAIRKSSQALQTGDYIPVQHNDQLFAYIRQKNDEKYLIILNMSHSPCYFKSQIKYHGVVLISTEHERENTIVDGTVVLSGDEGILVRLR